MTTTMVHEKPETKKERPYTQKYRGMITIAEVRIVGNFRKTFNQERLQELAENIGKVGVLEPILVRQDEDDGWILIAGERRLRAAKLAGFAEIPAVVLDVTSAQAAELQAFENLHREDLGPIEEARAFNTLLGNNTYTVPDLAKRVDKSETYVYQSIALLQLPNDAIEAIEEGKITPAHGHQILRAASKYRDTLTKFAITKHSWHERYPTVSEVRDQVEKTVEKKLSDAPFPTNTPYAGEIACTACPSNSTNQEMLIPDLEKGRCTNPGCFSKKKAAVVKEDREKIAKRFEGFQNVGEQSRSWQEPTSIKGFPIVTDEIRKLPKVKTLIEEKPEFFGWGIIKPSQYGGGKKQHGYLVCIQPEKLNEVLPKDKAVKKDSSSAPYAKPKPKSEKETFIEETVEARIKEATHTALKTVPEKRIVEYFAAQWKKNSWRRKEIKEAGFDVEKLNATDVLRLLFLNEVNENTYHGEGAVLEIVAGEKEAKTLAAQFIRDAEAEWLKKHPAKEAKK